MGLARAWMASVGGVKRVSVAEGGELDDWEVVDRMRRG